MAQVAREASMLVGALVWAPAHCKIRVVSEVLDEGPFFHGTKGEPAPVTD
jgi:hypothetical protein